MPDAGPLGTAHPITLTDGTATRTREVTPDDLGPVQALHRRCSRGSRALRYHAGKPQLSWAGWRLLSDPERGTTLVTTTAERRDHIIAMTNVMRTDRPGVGELAVLVEDEWQSKGLGTALAAHAADVARRAGHHTLTAAVAAVNTPMLHVLKRLVMRPIRTPGPVLDVDIPL
ncbi:acetyltransferase (GNAT) family protein [Streptomyces sp. SLBN-118]|uniref:GNAT family N-acetyltransferase n=1 Tax=Streptomyces sp. SLBN-118 TaxID=2768454 RepID=UPI001153B310|nr:GNAT family N-acetyltransferase [Streptomyces sp. SLBN-118]TQK50144.1 acetyltransferase (GNAT) family protein [Streptomyces sp. SLBN-118]